MCRAVVVLLLLASAGPLHAAGNHRYCGTTREGGVTALAAHAEREARHGNLRSAANVAAASDVGNVAVLLDEGELALRRNILDLASVGVEFSPEGVNYRASRVDRPVTGGGTALPLSDDSNMAVALPFAFSFRGATYDSVFVNSDGNLSFGAADSASTSRSLGRFLAGPPRIAPLFADLDPAQPGASVTTRSEGDSFSVIWSDVPQFGKTDKNSFQVTLFRNGRIAFAWAAGLTATLDEGVVGIAPGSNRGGFTPVDMSGVASAVSGGAIAESFRLQNELDLVAAARKFYRTHADEFQQLLFFTNQSLISRGTFAYENNVKNTDLGTGVGVEDFSGRYGSAGRLESVVMMDALSKYSEDPQLPINGEDTSLSLIGHEVGHRWLASARFRDGATNSSDLLGRDLVHWSFFMDSDGSFDEGNELSDLGGGQFRTAGASLRYGALDQYIMGLRRPDEVPPILLVRNPLGAGSDPGRDPQTGITFQGTRRDVTIGEVIAAEGPRSPAASTTLAPWRQAFVYVSVGGAADPAAIAKLDRIRRQWEGFFTASVDSRRRVNTRLQ